MPTNNPHDLQRIRELASEMSRTHIADSTVRELAESVPFLLATLDRYARACAEGLPREPLACPHCGEFHVDGANGAEFATIPHHTHLCEHCGKTWPAGRWSFGVAPTIGAPIECDERGRITQGHHRAAVAASLGLDGYGVSKGVAR